MVSYSLMGRVIESLRVLAIWSMVCFATVSAYGQPESPLVYNFGETDDRSGWRVVTGERLRFKMLFPSGVEVREAKQRFAEGDFAVTFYSSYSTLDSSRLDLRVRSTRAFSKTCPERSWVRCPTSLCGHLCPASESMLLLESRIRKTGWRVESIPMRWMIPEGLFLSLGIMECFCS